MIFVIRSCPKLTDLHITSKDKVQESLLSEIVVSKSLQKLKLHVIQTYNPLLKILTLPALTDISIEFDYESAVTHGFQKELLGFFSRSKCKLNQMILKDCGFDEAELLECLKHDSCAGLVDLQISSADIDNVPMFTDSVLLALTDMRPVENNLPLPKLTDLTLTSCLGGSPSRLGTMILSRCIPRGKAVQLQYLDINGTNLGRGDVVLLRLAQTQGLKFWVNLDDEHEIGWGEPRPFSPKISSIDKAC